MQSGEMQLVSLMTLLFATMVMGAKVRGLGGYKEARKRRDAAGVRMSLVKHLSVISLTM